ncbi:MAG: hypothetical protein V4713_03040 [Pseudomonadota bacterium]
MLHHRFLRWSGLFLCSSLLLACSSYGPPAGLTGMSRDEVVARMGPPDMTRQMYTGSRLEFARGPLGKQTWFVDFDAAGRAIRAEQVLTEQNFNRIQVGMTQGVVLELLGKPHEVQVLGRGRGAVWGYRYENYVCQWFQIELTLEQQVRSAGYGVSPECARLEDHSAR